MLQIVTRQYFTDGADVHETPQRGVLYTNCLLMRRDVITFPVGELAPPAYTPGGVFPAGATVVEYLEAGENSVLVATGGSDLIDDFAAFLSFALNAIFTQDHDLAHRLVPPGIEQARRDSAATMFDGTFDPAKFVTDVEFDDARTFMTELLELQRPHYEAAMRAIKRIVRATQRAEEDPSIAYTDIVAALESLSTAAPAAAPLWEDVPTDVRTEIDQALTAVPPEAADDVRQAIAASQGVRLARRFRHFINDDYFRDGAAGVERPLRRLDLDRVLTRAYEIRSRNVHTLTELPPEAWVVGGRGDTIAIPGLGLILTIQGLTRLARYVVREYVRSAPTGIDTTFDWRGALPGQIRMQWAPQYWLDNSADFNHRTAERYFQALAGQLIAQDGGGEGPIPDMRAVLEVIEKTVNGNAAGPARDAMVGIYALWHRRMVPELHRENAAKLLSRHRQSLESPSLTAFVTALVSEPIPEWSADEWLALSDTRVEERMREKESAWAPTIDAAVHACASGALWEAGCLGEAYARAALAVDEAPGNEYLRAWEAGTPAGEVPVVNLTHLLHGETEPEAALWPLSPSLPA